jgi:regulatory protein
MKITAIKPQVKKQGRFSVFVDGKYSFPLSESGLLQTKLQINQEINDQELEELKNLASDDKIYVQALNLVAVRIKTQWEVEQYLKRKGASPSLTLSIVNKLTKLGFIDDKRYVVTYVRNRRSLRSSSKRKITSELKMKRVKDHIIEESFEDDEGDDKSSLKEMVAKKRKQSKYQDNMKLMQYLSRQGYNYGDIKEALEDKEEYLE